MPMSVFQNGLEIVLFGILIFLLADFEQSVTNNISLKYDLACVLMYKSSSKQVKNDFQTWFLK